MEGRQEPSDEGTEEHQPQPEQEPKEVAAGCAATAVRARGGEALATDRHSLVRILFKLWFLRWVAYITDSVLDLLVTDLQLHGS